MELSTEARGRRLRAAALLTLLPAVTVWVTACKESVAVRGPGEAIDREEFVAVIVDLRSEAFRRPSGFLPAGEHEVILERHGLTADDLSQFIEVYGRDVPYMGSVWAEIQTRMSEVLQGHEEEGVLTESET